MDALDDERVMEFFSPPACSDLVASERSDVSLPAILAARDRDAEFRICEEE